MAHVQRKATRYGTRHEVRWRDDACRSRQRSFRRKSDAEAFAKLTTADALRGELRDFSAADRRFRDVAEDWYRSLEVKPRTAKRAREALDCHVLPVFGARRIGAITPADCREFVRTLKSKPGKHRGQPLSPATVRGTYAALQRVLQLAVEDGALRVNPAANVKLPTDRSEHRERFDAHFLTEGQVAALAEAMESKEPVYGLLTRFAAYTGLRAGEIAGLNIGDVDPLRREVRVVRTRARVKGGWVTGSPKSDRSRRTVPLPAWLAEDLATYLARHPRRDDREAPLFPGRRVGGYTHGARSDGSHRPGDLDWSQPWDRDVFYKRHFKPALVRAGLSKGVRFHDLRHTYASICAAQGIPLYRVSRRLGHSGIGITDQLYTHLFATDDDADMALLARPTADRPEPGGELLAMPPQLPLNNHAFPTRR